MTGKTRLALDIIERAVWTWGETFIGLLLAANVWDSTQSGHLIGILQAAQVAAVSAIPAALAVIKGLFASLLGNRDTAATLPAEVD